MAPPDALFMPIVVGDMKLTHRVVMAPLTRFRADSAHVPLDMVAEHYAQRASVAGTLLISEATFIAPEAGGYAHAPGIWSPAQIAAWKKVTDAVHARGSFIYLQMWALGRGAVPAVLAAELGRPADGGADSPYVSASAIPLSLRKPVPAPRALRLDEIAQFVKWYAQAAENAVLHAGFDGVEIHGANGYLPDQFLQDVSNKRTDTYGGSIENRARFMLEVLDAVVQRVGARKTALRLSPWSPYQDMGMADPVPTFTYLVQQILERHPQLAYLHVTERRLGTPQKGEAAAVNDEFVAEGAENDFIRQIWTAQGGKPLISAGGYTRETGMRVAQLKGDLIAYGRLFIANPDLPFRLKENLPLTRGDRSTYYTTESPLGYTDYPFSKEFLAAQAGVPQLGHPLTRL